MTDPEFIVYFLNSGCPLFPHGQPSSRFLYFGVAVFWSSYLGDILGAFGDFRCLAFGSSLSPLSFEDFWIYDHCYIIMMLYLELWCMYVLYTLLQYGYYVDVVTVMLFMILILFRCFIFI